MTIAAALSGRHVHKILHLTLNNLTNRRLEVSFRLLPALNPALEPALELKQGS
jgi:hypothetical protein